VQINPHVYIIMHLPYMRHCYTNLQYEPKTLADCSISFPAYRANMHNLNNDVDKKREKRLLNMQSQAGDRDPESFIPPE